MKPLNQWTAADVINLLELLKKVDKKIWIRVGIGVVAFAILFGLIIWPAWFRRVQIRSQIAKVKGQIITVETLNRKKPEWLQNQSDYTKFIQSAKERLYMPGETSLLLGAIAKLADESKINIVASRPKDLVDKFPVPFDEQYEGNIYDFTVEGSYHALGEFISKIESNPKLLRVRLFLLDPKEVSPETHIADVSLSAVSFKKGKA